MSNRFNEVKLTVNLDLTEFLSARNYSITDLFICYCMNNKYADLLKSYLNKKSDDQKIAFFQGLIRKDLVNKFSDIDSFDMDNYVLTEKGEILLDETEEYFTNLDIALTDISLIDQLDQNEKDEEKSKSLDDLVNSFIELFPKGIKNRAGYYIKGNKEDVRSKFVTFMRKYKYTHEVILKATEKYLNKQKNEGYAFCMLSNFFIIKNGTSLLATECEAIMNGSEDSELDLEGFHNQLM